MKDLINYYYNFNISDIYLMNGKYFFSYNGKKYIFKNCIDSYNNIEVISEVIKQIKTKHCISI